MAKYQQYDDYKELQSIFVEKIPMHWNVEPLYALCGFKQGKAHEPFIDDDGEFICVNARFVSTQGQGNSIKRCSVNLTPAKLYDILMVMSDLPNGRALARAFYVEELKNNYAVNQRVCAITAKKVHAKFLYYQLNRSPYFLMFNDGSNQTHLSNDAYKKYPVLLPSTIEQVQIANFLDYETAQIDTLIDKQQTLIQLLKEKRQAVISHAVTKGLNPNAPMKDSGVEWLGEVPEHWEVKGIKRLSEIKRGASPRPIADQKYFDDEGEYAWTRIADVSRAGMYLDTTTQRLSDLGASLSVKLEAGELFLSIAGTVGKPCITISKACIHDGFVYFPTLKINNKFLFYIFEAGQAYLGLGKMGTQLNLNTETVGGIEIGLPPKEEIEAIIKYIEAEKIRFHNLISKAEQAIQLMQERRTALISAAVTGKIDVRGWRASE